MITKEKIFKLAVSDKEYFVEWHKRHYIASTTTTLDEFSLLKHEVNALKFLGLSSPFDFSRFFDLSISEIQLHLNNPEYTNYCIPKKKGGSREIFAPAPELKKIQRRLNYYLQAYYLCIKPKEVHGFVINPHYLGSHCNITANASCHVGKKFVLNIDLKDFFPSIHAQLVLDLFSSDLFGFNQQIATALTLLTTFKGKLPIGAPTSPVISNFICLDLDKNFIDFANSNALSYSRYADDLTFSSNIPITDEIISNINLLIQKNNFTINKKKLRLKSSNRKQTVTGITVNEKVNVDRRLLKKTRAMLHDLITNGVESAARNHYKTLGNVQEKFQEKFIQKLNGYINFIGQVRGKDDALYIKFKTIFDLK